MDVRELASRFCEQVSVARRQNQQQLFKNHGSDKPGANKPDQDVGKGASGRRTESSERRP